jgi:hypothetical protein
MNPPSVDVDALGPPVGEALEQLVQVPVGGDARVVVGVQPGAEDRHALAVERPLVGAQAQPVSVGDAAHRDGVDTVDELLEPILAGGLAAAGEPLQVTVGPAVNPSRLVPMTTWQLNGPWSVMTSPARSVKVRSQTITDPAPPVTITITVGRSQARAQLSASA